MTNHQRARQRQGEDIVVVKSKLDTDAFYYKLLWTPASLLYAFFVRALPDLCWYYWHACVDVSSWHETAIFFGVALLLFLNF